MMALSFSVEYESEGDQGADLELGGVVDDRFAERRPAR